MKRNRIVWRRVLVAVGALCLVLGVRGVALAQAAGAAGEGSAWADPFQRDSPRSAVQACLRLLEEDRFGEVEPYLDLRFVGRVYAGTTAEQIARELDFVLQRGMLMDLGGLSEDPDGILGDGLPSYRELLGTIRHKGEETPIYLQRVPSESGQLIWKFSSLSLDQLGALFKDLEYPAYVKWVQRHIPEGSVLGLESFKWVILLASMLIAYPVVYLLALVISRVVSPRDSAHHGAVRSFLTKPVTLIIVLLIGSAVLHELGISGTAQRISRAKTIITIVGVWGVLSLLSLLRAMWSERIRRRRGETATIVLRPVFSSLRVLVVFAAIVLWLDNAGYNIGTLLAGLGIGGLAVALALQKPLEDLFGAVTLFTQQPVRINDFCRFGDCVGTVEEIGLRTTRVRTLDRTIVTVPNARFAHEYIENISMRESIRFAHEIRLAHDATADQVERVLGGIRSVVEGDPKVKEEGRRVRNKALDLHGIVIEVVAYVDTVAYDEFLEVAERINLSIIRVVEGAGTTLARWQETE